jgi:hypothetical protein
VLISISVTADKYSRILSVHSPTSGYCVLSHIPMIRRHVKVVWQRTSRATLRHSFTTTVWWSKLVVILVHTTDSTWYKVLYHHSMYVMVFIICFLFCFKIIVYDKKLFIFLFIFVMIDLYIFLSLIYVYYNVYLNIFWKCSDSVVFNGFSL